MADDQDLEEIRRRVDLVDLVSHYLTLKKAGANYKSPCPFHQERTPSFMISPEKQIYKCFGCGEGGDIFGFIMKMENLTFPEAVRLLAERSGVQLKTTSYNKPTMPVDEKNHLYHTNALAARYFQTILLKHPTGQSALEYLHKRGLTDETIKKFQLGYAPARKALAQTLAKRGIDDKTLTKAGNPDRFFNRIIFPLYDPLGNVIAFTGRAFPDDNKGPKYYNTPETTLFHKGRTIYGLHLAKNAIRETKSVVFVEGQMDVIASHQAGVQNVVASSGTALTIDHLRIMHRYAPKFILALDNDEAGQLATGKVAEISLSEGYDIFIAQIPQTAKDPGDLAISEPQTWKKAVQSAIPAVEWYFNRAFQTFSSPASPSLGANDKKQIAKYLLPIIARLPDVVERTHYLQSLSKKINIKEDILQVALNRFITPENNNPLPPPSTIPTSPHDLISSVLYYFIQYPVIAQNFHSALKDEAFAKSAYSSIAKQLKIWYNDNKSSKILQSGQPLSFLSKNLAGEDKQKLEKILSAVSFIVFQQDDDETIKEAIKESINHLRQQKRDQTKEEYAAAIAQAEESGDREKVKKLLSELQQFLS